MRRSSKSTLSLVALAVGQAASVTLLRLAMVAAVLLALLATGCESLPRRSRSGRCRSALATAGLVALPSEQARRTETQVPAAAIVA